jgi:polar amino acid transport system permease protein
MAYDWSFAPLLSFSRLWMMGLVTTIWLSAAAIVLGSLAAIPIAAALKSRSVVIRFTARAYVDLFRAIPALVLLSTLYFALPILTGIRLSALQVAVIGLTMNLTPFVAEILRSSFESIPTIQYDSGFVMGFRGWKLLYYILMPQVVRRVIPPLVGEYVTTLKLSSLAATIGAAELWNATGQVTTLAALPLEAKLVGAGLYVAIILPLLALFSALERRFGVRGLGEGTER